MEERFEKSTRKICDPCRCTWPTPHYFYTEHMSSDNGEQRARSRPSSANSVKSCGSSKKTITNSSKVASSDSRLMKKTCITTMKIRPKKKKDQSQKLDPENANQLRNDLGIIKKQLELLTQKKSEALDVTNEVKVLNDKCENQEREIKELKRKNKKLSKKIEEEDVLGDKARQLQEYEETLNTLYTECLDASQVMERSKQKICHCIKEKESEFQNMAKTKKELCKAIEDQQHQVAHLSNHLKKSQENERKHAEQNAELSHIVEELQSRLDEMSKELEESRQVKNNFAQSYHEELQEQERCHCREIQMKNKQIDELNCTIQKMKTRGCCKHKCSSLQAKYQQLERRYKYTVEKLNSFQQNNKKRCAELQIAKNNERTLSEQVVQLQCCCQQLTNIANESSGALNNLNASNEEKEAVIESQKKALAVKSKQLELLQKNQERLNQKVIELQEDVLTMKISCHSSQLDGTTVLGSEGCSIRLSEELEDLINALYEEIDRTLEKDAQIQQQYQQICHLQCGLASKEKELIRVRSELKNIQQRLMATSKEKQALVGRLKAVTCMCE